jgi:hypothetical protein
MSGTGRDWYYDNVLAIKIKGRVLEQDRAVSFSLRKVLVTVFVWTKNCFARI